MNKTAPATHLTTPPVTPAQSLAALKFAGADGSGNFAALLDTMAQDQPQAPKPAARHDDLRDDEAPAAPLPTHDTAPLPAVKSDSKRPARAKAAKADDDQAPPAATPLKDDHAVDAAPVTAPVTKATLVKADPKPVTKDQVDDTPATKTEATPVDPTAAVAAVPVSAAPATPVRDDAAAPAPTAKVPAIKPHGPVVMPTGDAADAAKAAAPMAGLAKADAIAATPNAAVEPANEKMAEPAAPEISVATKTAAAPAAPAPAAALPKLEAAAPRALDPLLQRLNLAVAPQASVAPAAGSVAQPVATAPLKSGTKPPAVEAAATVASNTGMPIFNSADATPTSALAAAASNGSAVAATPTVASLATATPNATQPAVNPTTVAPQLAVAATQTKVVAPVTDAALATSETGLAVDASGALTSETGAGAGKLIALNYPAAGALATNSARGATGLAGLPAVVQVAVQMTRSAKSGDKSFDIQLHPAELGRVEVKLDIDKNGNVTAHVQADSQAALDQLQRGSAALERALNEAGLKTGGDALNFSLSDQGQQSAGGNAAGQDRQQNTASRQTGPALAEGSGMIDDDLTTTALTLTAQAGRVDIRA